MSDFRDVEVGDTLAPLGSTAAQPLLTLSERERQDPRILALVAQKDPVYLARLLGPVNATSRTEPVRTAEQAIRALGAQQAFQLLRGCAEASLALPAIAPEVRRYLLVQAVSLALTTRRVGMLLKLQVQERVQLSLAALFDTLGLYALLSAQHERRDALEGQLLELARHRSPLPQAVEWLQGYEHAGAQLARRWGAPSSVPAVILGSSVPVRAATPRLARVLALAQELVAARMNQRSDEEDEITASPLMREFGLESSALSERVLDLAFIGF